MLYAGQTLVLKHGAWLKISLQKAIVTILKAAAQ